MAMEVSCGSCGGRLLVETFGVIVACPHCGIHLSIPDPEQTNSESALLESQPTSDEVNSASKIVSSETPQPTEPATPPETTPPDLTPESLPSDVSEVSATSEPELEPEPEPEPTPPADVVDSPSSIFHPEEEKPPQISGEAAGWLSSPNLSLRDTPDPDVQGFAEPTNDTDATPATPEPVAEVLAEQPDIIDQSPPATTEVVVDDFNKIGSSLIADMTPTTSSPMPFVPSIGSFGDIPSSAPQFGDAETSNIAAMAGSEIPQNFAGDAVAAGFAGQSLAEANAKLMSWLMIVGSYASLATIFLLYFLFFGRAHQLESLPDLMTIQQLGGRTVIPRPENELPSGHVLRFGETQRFGNLRVTPLRVTRGPMLFEHESGDKTQERTPTDPVLKLWLKFENVSDNQPVVPLDTTLLSFRRATDHRVASYNAIFRSADRYKKNAEVWYPFDRLSADSEWLIVGQHTNGAVEPHKSLETFVPSGEQNLEDLTGDLVWRVHFRKGYGPKTGNGVTTLIDVRFNSSDIKTDAT